MNVKHVFLRYHKPAGVLSTTLPTRDGHNILQALSQEQVAVCCLFLLFFCEAFIRSELGSRQSVEGALLFPSVDLTRILLG
jgi:hypothetical protein